MTSLKFLLVRKAQEPFVDSLDTTDSRTNGMFLSSVTGPTLCNTADEQVNMFIDCWKLPTEDNKFSFQSLEFCLISMDQPLPQCLCFTV